MSLKAMHDLVFPGSSNKMGQTTVLTFFSYCFFVMNYDFSKACSNQSLLLVLYKTGIYYGVAFAS